jgi:hypothetical protein
MRNKRFLFATIAIICVTITAVILKYPASDYVKLVGIITAIFTAGQTFTDHHKIKKGQE